MRRNIINSEGTRRALMIKARSHMGRASVLRLAPMLCLTAGLAACVGDEEPIRTVPGGDARSGELLIEFYGCGSCHTIPGIRGATGVMGPPLTAFGRRSLIAGNVANEANNLISWIVDPQTIEPGTAMPAVGATPSEARDMAAYLYGLQ